MAEFGVVERGDGPPLVLVPGIQGRWEFARGLVDGLARDYRVITFSLCDERRRAGDGASIPPDIEVFAGQVDTALDRLGLSSAHVLGVSFGGLVALRFAATRSARTRGLVLISAPGPQWHLRRRHEWYARLPWLFGPLFLAEAPLRLHHEVRTALPEGAARRRYLRRQLRTLVTAPVSVSRMAARARLIRNYDRAADCARVSVPTLIIQGEPALDHVTGDGGTAEYARLITRAQLVTMAGTGHLGSMTRPDYCAGLVHGFLAAANKDTRNSAA